MNNDATIKIRVSSAELDYWRKEAQSRKIGVSELIRARMNGDKLPHKEGAPIWPAKESDEEQDSVVQPRSPKAPKADVSRRREVHERAADKPVPKTCPHGEKVGWRCTLCGGIVK